MDLQLEDLQHISLAREDYEMLCACSHEHEIAIVWLKGIDGGYHYLLKKYNEEMKEISSCEFCKKIRYDIIRMYHNICILINLAGGKEKQHFLKNALLITPSGIELKEFPVGMGLTSVSISPQGTIWCGYDNDGTYKEYSPTVSKGISCIIAAWNFLGELVYEMEYPLYDETFGFFHDCFSIYAKNNDEVYFFYYDKFDLCLLKDMKERILIPFREEHKRPFNFTIKEHRPIVYFEPYVEDMKSLEIYEMHRGTLNYTETIHILFKQEEIKEYDLYINEDTLLLKWQNHLYRYVLR